MNIPAQAQERLLAVLTAQPQVQRIWLSALGRWGVSSQALILISAWRPRS
jgi:hypothetical protein